MNFYKKLSVAEVLVEAAPLSVGEPIFFLGATTGVAEQTLEELVRRWPVRETPWLLRLRSAAARKSGAEVRSILQEMERTQVYLSAAGRQELAFWKGGAA